jgi:hypothetical protein
MIAPPGYSANPFAGARDTWVLVPAGAYGDEGALGFVRKLRVPAQRRVGSAGHRRGGARSMWFYGLPEDHPGRTFVKGWHSHPHLFGGPEEPSSMQAGDPGPGYKTAREAFDGLLAHRQMAEQVAPARDDLGAEPF